MRIEKRSYVQDFHEKKLNYETCLRDDLTVVLQSVPRVRETRRRLVDQPTRGAIGKRQSWRTRAAAAPAVVAPRRRSPTLHSHIVRRWDRTCVAAPIFKLLHPRGLDTTLSSHVCTSDIHVDPHHAVLALASFASDFRIRRVSRAELACLAGIPCLSSGTLRVLLRRGTTRRRREDIVLEAAQLRKPTRDCLPRENVFPPGGRYSTQEREQATRDSSQRSRSSRVSRGSELPHRRFSRTRAVNFTTFRDTR